MSKRNNFMKKIILKDLNSGHYFWYKDRKTHNPSAEFIPALGVNLPDGHIFIAGKTQCGKSYLAKQIIENDKLGRKVALFTNIPTMDKAYEKLFKAKKMFKMVKGEPTNEYEINIYELLKVGGLNNCICLFDDCDKDKEFKDLQEWILSYGRHRGLVGIVLRHELRGGFDTKALHTDCAWVCVFPHANSSKIKDYMLSGLKYPNWKVNEIFRQAKKDGRYLFFHNFAPEVVCSAKSTWPDQDEEDEFNEKSDDE